MSNLSDFASGVTELPRQLIGGAAVALGADRQGTNDFLGLDPNDEATSLIDKLENNPAKFLGSIVPYVFLPTRLFGSAAGKALARQARRTGKPFHKAKAIADQSAHLGLAMGTYGAVEELAKAQTDGRESEAIGRFASDAMFAVGFGALAKTAFVGAEKYKDHLMQKKYIKDVLLDAGMPPSLSKGMSDLSQADRHAMLVGFSGKLQNVKEALAGTIKSTLPAEKISGAEPHSVLKDLFSAFSPDVEKNVEKMAQKPHNKRPPVQPQSGKGKIAPEAASSVAAIRKSADDMDAHLNALGRHANNAKVALLEMFPKLEDRQKISDALDVGGDEIYKTLTPEMKQAVDSLRETFDQMGRGLQKAGVIKGFLPEYLPHILNKIGTEGDSTLQEILDSIGKRTHTSTNT